MSAAFAPKPGGTQTISATSTNSQFRLDGGCGQVQFYNAGPNAAFFRSGAAAQTAVTTTDAPIPPGAVICYSKADPAHSHGALICATGQTATVYVTDGKGE